MAEIDYANLPDEEKRRLITAEHASFPKPKRPVLNAMQGALVNRLSQFGLAKRPDQIAKEGLVDWQTRNQELIHKEGLRKLEAENRKRQRIEAMRASVEADEAMPIEMKERLLALPNDQFVEAVIGRASPLTDYQKQIYNIPGSASAVQTQYGKAPEVVLERDPEIERFQYGVENPDFAARQLEMKRAGVVPVEREQERILGKYWGDTYVDLTKAGFTAVQDMEDIHLLKQLANSPDLAQGITANVALSIRKAGRALGFKTDNVGDEELFLSIVNRYALQLRSPESGMGMPGAMSDNDIIFLKSLVPNLANEPEGSVLIIEAMRLKRQRAIDLGRLAQEYLEKHRIMGPGFFKVVRKFAAENPLFDNWAVRSQELLDKLEKSKAGEVDNPDPLKGRRPGLQDPDEEGQR